MWSCAQEAQQPNKYAQALTERERHASTPEGACAILKDHTLLTVVQDYLKRPASGRDYTRWASSLELRKAVRIAAKILQFCGDLEATAGLQRAIVAAASATLPIEPETSAMIATTLSQAEQALSGRNSGLNGQRALQHDLPHLLTSLSFGGS